PADCVLDNVTNDVFRRVVNATGFAHFRLVFNARLFRRGDDDLAEEAFIDAAENMNRNRVEVVRRLAMRKALANLIEYSLVRIELVAVEQAVLFEDDAVVNAIQTPRSRDEVFPGLSFRTQVFNQRI